MKVEAMYQKNRTRFDVPIRPTLAEDLGKLIARTPAGRPLFPMRKGSGAAMVRADLQAAGLPEIDEESQTRSASTRCVTRRSRGSWKLE